MPRFDFAFTPPRGPSRSECVRHAEEILRAVERGAYVSPSGRSVEIGDAVRRAVAGTLEHRPEERVDGGRTKGRATVTSVVNGTSLASARAVASRGIVPLVLNFASAHEPGGGFLRGARAQEESLARSSALYPCLRGRGMYAHHGGASDAMYTSWMIWSPDVPVLRDDVTGHLLEEPYACAFLTAPAPNATIVLERDPSRADEVEREMRARVTRSLAVASAHGHTHLVLGAWGCGVFGNDPAVVADAYRRELDGDYAGVFEEIVFAVLDLSDERRTIRPFVERFA